MMGAPCRYGARRRRPLQRHHEQARHLHMPAADPVLLTYACLSWSR
jgi:hypothetical protein